MKKHCLLLAIMIFTQAVSAAEYQIADDAPKGFIHLTDPKDTTYKLYINSSSITRIEQASKKIDGTTAYFIILNGAGTITMDFKSKEEADKSMKKLLDLISVATK